MADIYDDRNHDGNHDNGAARNRGGYHDNGGAGAGRDGGEGGRDDRYRGGGAYPPVVPPSASVAYGDPEGYLALPGGAEEEDGAVHLWHYVHVILRRRWTVAAVFAFCVLTALVFSLAATSEYRSTALLQIQPGGPNVIDFADVQESAQAAQAYGDFFQTQYGLLASRQLARRTIDKLGLENDPWLSGDAARATALGKAKTWITSLVSGPADEDEQARRRDKDLLENFADSVVVRPRRKSFLVEVSFASPDPETAQKVTETLADEYIDLTLDQRIQAATQGGNFISKQLAITKARLEESEQQLHEFAKGKEIVALDQEEQVIHDRLTSLNTKLTDAQAERIRLEAIYAQATGPDRDSLPDVVSNPVIEQLKQELAKTRAERAQLGGRFTAEYPPVKDLDARIAELEATIGKEIDHLISSIHANYQTALQRESLLRSQLDRQRKLVASYEEKAIDFKIMRRDVDTNRDIYEDLLRRMKEVQVTEAIRSSNISLVDHPEVPLEPDSPDLPLNLAVSMMLGLFGGVGLAFFQEYMDDSIASPEDVERFLRLPALGSIPEFAAVRASDEESGDVFASADLEVADRPTSAGAESIRTLRASLFLAAAGGLPSRLLITSARPGEGKTCIASNLATALAQMGRRIVIVDCDLRRPRLHEAMSTGQSPGVTNYLTGNVDLATILHESGRPGLDVIPAGPVPPNPVDLLDSVRMGDLLRELDDRYDHIIVDAPPALGFADVPVLSNRLGGGCLLVTRASDTPRRVARGACDYLFRMQSKLLGVVLNRVSTRSSSYSYYGYYGYYGSYGSYGKGQESVPAQSGVEKAA